MILLRRPVFIRKSNASRPDTCTNHGDEYQQQQQQQQQQQLLRCAGRMGLWLRRLFLSSLAFGRENETSSFIGNEGTVSPKCSSVSRHLIFPMNKQNLIKYSSILPSGFSKKRNHENNRLNICYFRKVTEYLHLLAINRSHMNLEEKFIITNNS